MKKLSYKQLLELPPRTPLGAQDFYNAAENQISVEYDFDKHCFVGSASSKMSNMWLDTGFGDGKELVCAEYFLPLPLASSWDLK